MIGEESSIQILAANLREFWRVPPVAAEQRHLDSLLLCLTRNQTDFGVVARDIDGLRTRRFDGSQLCVEVRIAGAIALVRDNRTSHLLEVPDKDVCKTHGVVILYVAQYRNL